MVVHSLARADGGFYLHSVGEAVHKEIPNSESREPLVRSESVSLGAGENSTRNQGAPEG